MHRGRNSIPSPVKNMGTDLRSVPLYFRNCRDDRNDRCRDGRRRDSRGDQHRDSRDDYRREHRYPWSIARRSAGTARVPVPDHPGRPRSAQTPGTAPPIKRVEMEDGPGLNSGGYVNCRLSVSCCFLLTVTCIPWDNGGDDRFLWFASGGAKHTIRFHLKNIYRKLQEHNRLLAISAARERKII